MKTKLKPDYKEFTREMREKVYSRDGFYFVTLATRDAKNYFGDIEDGAMKISVAGRYVDKQIKWLHEQYHYVDIDAYVIMPNHVHLILALNYSRSNVSLQETTQRSLPELIEMLKQTSKRLIHLFGNRTFDWQRRSFDHSIRAKRTLQCLRDFIANNPNEWELDRHNGLNLFM